MIFVTVGGMRAFKRLIEEMDRIAGELDEPVVMQIGSTDYQPRNCDYFRFMSREDIEKLYRDARAVVCHAGTGSILSALAHNKPLVLVPRLTGHGEVLDDHQLEIARQMEAQGVAVVYDVADLASAIANAATGPVTLGGGGQLVERLKQYLDHIRN